MASEKVRSMTNPKPTSHVKRACLWIVGAFFCAAVVGLVGAGLPNRVRLLGFFAIVQGLSAGVLLGYLVRSLRFRSTLLVTGLAAVLGAGAVVATSWMAFNEYRAELKASIDKPNPQAAIAARVLAAKLPPDATPEQIAEYEHLRKVLKSSLPETKLDQQTFRAYLTHRVSQLGLDENGSLLVWIAEFLAAGLACSIVARHFAVQPFCSNCSDWYRVVRSQLFEGKSAQQVADCWELENKGVLPEAVQVDIRNCQCAQANSRIDAIVWQGKKSTRLQLSGSENQSNSDSEVDKRDQPFDRVRLLRLIDEAQGI